MKEKSKEQILLSRSFKIMIIDDEETFTGYKEIS